MTKAIGIATRARTLTTLQNGIVSIFASLVLAACGGGAQTTENPTSQVQGNGNNSAYAGPAAANEAVLKFQQEFWSNAKTTNRCGNCHNEVVGQLPMFVRNDDINEAYAAAIGVVDQAMPSASRVVEKVSSMTERHNCWVDDPGVCGTIMTTWIENWVGDTADGGREMRNHNG